MKFKLPKIYPITDRRISGLSHLEQVRRLIAGGATLVQLRDKTSSALEFYADAKQAVEFAQTHGVKVIVNDRADIALAVGADGVHLGQDDLPVPDARALLGPDSIIGVSTHSLEQAESAVQLPIDYLAIGPIFETPTKSDPDPVIGLDGLKGVRAVANLSPLVAIGGISLDRVEKVIECGADSVALISNILAEPDQITARIKRLLSL